MAKINIDGKEYDSESMSEKALAQVGSIQYVDSQLRELQMRAAAYQTARLSYANALKRLLEEGEEGSDDEAKITIPDDLNLD